MYPFLRITEQFALPMYIFVLSLTYCVCLIWADHRAKKQGRSRNTALDIALMIMLGGFIGARLFHVFYESPEKYLAEPVEILKFWNGGFVFFGGFFGALAASVAFIKWKRESFLDWADFFAPILSLGYILGRFACFLNGCCYGALCDLPWAVEFNFPGLPVGPRHPTQLYASLFELFAFLIVLNREKAHRKSSVAAAGGLFFTWLALHSVGRLIMEAFRDDFRGPTLGLSVSSWISVGLLVVSCASAFFLYRRSTR